MILHLRAAVEQLYAVPPARFTPLRSELVAEAKSAGEKDLATSIGALRKPTVAAWAVNHFVREHGDEVGELRSFAALLREAQRTLDADQLRLLGRERAKRVDALADRIAEVAAHEGQKLGAGVAQEVRETLTALIADEEAEASVLTGSLVKALSYSGFGSVDVADVVALAEVGGRGRDDAGRRARRSPCCPAGEAIPSTSRSGAAAGGPPSGRGSSRRSRPPAPSCAAADRQVAVLTARQEEVTEGIADLERRLATARARLEKVTGELDEAGGIRDRRERQEAAAQRGARRP